jgi:hypothetical protein
MEARPSGADASSHALTEMAATTAAKRIRLMAAVGRVERMFWPRGMIYSPGRTAATADPVTTL